MGLSREDIVQGLRDLGVETGMVLMVHSSLGAFGPVEGGADTVIDALIEAVGPEGTLLMPAMGGAPVFDVNETKSNVGEIADSFWRRPEVTRSIHPTHSAAGIGPLTDQIFQGHLDQSSALGADSPWGRVAKLENGFILFLGCDQDRNTLLHTAEDIANGAYLNTISRDYFDENRQVKKLVMERFPGPHRDFLQMDRLFLQAGAMRMSKIGRAMCRLMKAGQILDLAVKELQRDPAAVLCSNPHCMDCVRQRAAIKRARLASEDFTLSAVLDACLTEQELEQALWDIAAEGIVTLEIGTGLARALGEGGDEERAQFIAILTKAQMQVAVWPVAIPWSEGIQSCLKALECAADATAALSPQYLKLSPWLADTEGALPQAIETLKVLAEAAGKMSLTLLIENNPCAVWRDKLSCADVLAQVASPHLRFAFNPAHFAHVRENPFLNTWNRGKLKKHTAQLMVVDGCGHSGWPTTTLPGQGQAEVKELISILRCRSFDGLMTISTGQDANFSFKEAAAAFWHLLDTM